MMTKKAMCCKCGARWAYSDMPESEARRIDDIWWKVHSGPGHAPCDARTAAQARRANKATP